MGRVTAYSNVGPRKVVATPQRQPIPGKERLMHKNEAGGYVFKADDWTRLDRFLILGTEKGSYYVKERKLTLDNAAVVQRCLNENGQRVVARIVEVSQKGTAPKNDPALLALAMAASHKDKEVRKLALEALPLVARIGTHLFHFAEYVEQFRGWGRALREAVAAWYMRDKDKVAYDLIKYQSRDGWSHRDLIRLSHPKPDTDERAHMLAWAVGKTELEASKLPMIIQARDILHSADAAKYDIPGSIELHRIPREAIPTEMLNDREVWKALLKSMGIEAIVRNLNKMTAIDLFKDRDVLQFVVNKLTSAEDIAKSRIHPIKILTASIVYGQGSGLKGSLSWRPVMHIVDALDRAYELAFVNAPVSQAPIVIGVDTSGSMKQEHVSGMENMTANLAAAAVSLTMARQFPNAEIVYFDTDIHTVGWSRRSSYKEVVNDAARFSGGTNCALPIMYATQHVRDAKAVVIFTDSQTWAGTMHPSQAMKVLRAKGDKNCRLVTCAMSANEHIINDADDQLAFNVAGLSSDVPELVYSFVEGEF